MPWQEVCTMEERMKFVLATAAGEDSMAALCEDYGVSRKTGYKWLQRYLAAGQGAWWSARTPRMWCRGRLAKLRAGQ